MFSTRLCFLLGILILNALAERGYVITAPQVFYSGKSEQVCVDLHDVDDSVTVEIELESGTDKLAQTTIVFTDKELDQSKCAPILVTSKRQKISQEAMLKVHGYSSASWRFSDEKAVRFYDEKSRKRHKFTFIQSDKPVYKPGQLVQFRVITLDSRLKPDVSPIPTVYIESPGGARVQQWTNSTSQSGLSQFSFQLSDEPEEGKWKIVLNYGDRQEKQTFKVEEYVLPTYEVTLTPPKYLTFQSESAKFEVCAKYTFGQPVRGEVEATVCIERRRRYYQRRNRQDKKDSCTFINPTLVDGCTEIEVSKHAVGWDSYTEYKRRVQAVFSAQVKEKGTGVYLNATGSPQGVDFSRYDVKVSMEGPAKFKPGLPYNAKAVVKRPDGIPAAGKIVEISISNWMNGDNYAKSYTSDENGLVFFTIPPVVDKKTSFSITAKAIEYSSSFWPYSSPQARLSVNGWFSPSGSFLQIIPVKDQLLCETDATFSIKYSTSESAQVKLMYKTHGVGGISPSHSIPLNLSLDTRVIEPDDDDEWDKSEYSHYWWGRYMIDDHDKDDSEETEVTQSPVATHKGTISLTLPITSDITRTSFLIVYYIRSDGEIVADSIQLDVADCSPNKVEMDFSKTQALPGESVDMTVQASPNSICGFSVVDKSVFLLGGNNQLSLSKILGGDKIGRFLPTSNAGPYENENDLCQSMNSDSEESIERIRYFHHYYGHGGNYWEMPYDDAYQGFQQGGLTVMSNLKIRTSPCIKQEPQYNSNVAAILDDLGPADMERLKASIPRGRVPKRLVPKQSKVSSRAGTGADEKPIVEERTYFPETWLWDLVLVDDTGSAIVETEVPHTITQWIGNTMCLSEQDGFGISPPAIITAFQPVFVSMTLPYSVIRGERIPVKVTTSNYLADCLTVEIRFEESEDYTVLASPQSNDLSNVQTACVCGQDTTTAEFMIEMKEIGDVNISVSTVAVSDQGLCPPDSKMSKLVEISDSVTRPINVEPEGAKREYTNSDYFCLSGTDDGDGSASINYELPLPSRSSLVDGSERAYVSVVGDVMGSALSNLDNLLRMPTGCGEQNMLGFAPNIFVSNYLNSIDKNTPELQAKAKRHMEVGYQKELKYAHPDQSYSAFGPGNGGSGSMWLTAFVVKCFGLADSYIYVDSEVQRKSMSFFEDNQQENGCFPQLGFVHHKEMQGGIGSGEGNTQALSAYVLIAMLGAGKSPNSPEVVKAVSCLSSTTPENAYTASLVSYALGLYDPKDSRSIHAYQTLKSMVTENGDVVYWKATENRPAPKGHHWYHRTESADVEATAYGLMSTLVMTPTGENIAASLPIVNWLSKQRNAQGGFGSTQDTVIGLQALSKFASLVYYDGLEVDISVKERQNSAAVADFSVNSESRLVEYTAKLPQVKDLTLQATGRGCFMFQTNVKYNVKNMDKKNQMFHTHARTFRSSNSTNACKTKTLRICTKYKGREGVSNMAIVEVKMQTGWAAVKSSIEVLKEKRRVDLQRYEIDADGAVQLYFNSIGSARKCFTFKMEQVMEAVNVKPGVITTYDYYKQEDRQETSYAVWPCNTNKIIPGPLPEIMD